MDTITRLIIAPFLVLSLTLLGCAVFPGQPQETTAPQQLEKSTATIILPADDQPTETVSVESSQEQTGTATFRGLQHTNGSFDSTASTPQDRSLVPDGLLSNEATPEPARNEQVFRADRIEFIPDSVPFGNRLRATSHLAIEPGSTASPMVSAAQTAVTSMSILDDVGKDSKIEWSIEQDNLTFPINGTSTNLQFDIDENKEEEAKSQKLLIGFDGKYYDRNGKEVLPAPKSFTFSETWAATDKITVTINGKKVIPDIDAGSTTGSAVLTKVQGALDGSDDSNKAQISWSISDSDPPNLVATFAAPWQTATTTIKFNVTPDPEAAQSATITPKTYVATVPTVPDELKPAIIKNLPEGKTVEINVWIEPEIIEGTPSTTTFRTFEVVTPSSDLKAPVITKVANTKYVDPGGFSEDDPVEFYFEKPFVRLEGKHGTSEKGELSFILRDPTGKTVDSEIENLKVEPISESQRTWKAQFNLSKPIPAGGRLFLLRERDDKFNYSPTVLKLETETEPGLDVPDTISFKIETTVGNKPVNKIANVFPTNQTEITLKSPSTVQTIDAKFAIVATTNGGQTFLDATSAAGSSAWTLPIKGLKEGRQDIVLNLMLGDVIQEKAATTIPVFVRSEGPRVISVEPSNFGTAPGVTVLTITFDPNNPIKDTWASAPDTLKGYFSIYPSDGSGVFTGVETAVPGVPTSAKFDDKRNSVTLAFGGLAADIYQLQIDGDKFEDVYGNKLVGDNGQQGTLYTKVLGGDGLAAGGLAPKFKADDSPTINTGISGTTGEFVAFPEYVKRPVVESGFNPNDKVETRVVRLYYYRDAHRIAQIVNRKVQSYNRAAVDTNRQLADKSRNQANQLTVARQNAERNAIIMANKTRQQENELQRAENSLNGSLQQLTNYRRDNPDANPNDDATIKQLESLVNSFSNQVNNLQADVQASRDQEVQANEQAQQAEAQEKLAREEQFRREVAAAHSDPDTYAPGKLESVDPVEQVSVSVVGEGLIQLRGPLKGINLIRTAIDQLDSPVGQVRISLHTIQINGEHADRMEVVAKKVQTYIDHARFLTMQSSEMLRKAVVQVASQKAEEASALFPGATQMDRDERYITAFFGKDFIDELRAMDSEFLHTGNKLLSLHSMDTTSLASALNLMALAKNSTRQEIFATFDEMCQTQLPQAEQNYFAAGWTCPKKKKNRFHRCKKCEPEYCPMAGNARFESLRGFFDMQISNDDTMTPLQREFIRLAQIFKSRLVTELEYKQRVMERAIIEERLGDRNAELKAAKKKEDDANKALEDATRSMVEQRVVVITTVRGYDQEIKNIMRNQIYQVAESIKNTARVGKNIEEFKSQIDSENVEPFKFSVNAVPVTLTLVQDEYVELSDAKMLESFEDLRQKVESLYQIFALLYACQEPDTGIKEEMDRLRTYLDDLNDNKLEGTKVLYSVLQFWGTVADDFQVTEWIGKNGLGDALVIGFTNSLSNALNGLLRELASGNSEVTDGEFEHWLDLKFQFITPFLESPSFDQQTKVKLSQLIQPAGVGFRKYLETEIEQEIAQKGANDSRRPLDHKKFLDMLVDDLEEKYIELLDGTRAQVANIDNYLKRVTTALDDDFNTQFYYPAFKYIREANVSYDVQFGQFETTTLLANNREFAKADPSATMEFDLPERDILLKEGIDGAKAMMNDVGALASDSSFLAMAKMNSPNSGATPNPGSTGGSGVVRSVLPGLGGSTSEQVMSQNSNGGQQFGSNLENLIPDPAIYKFETGTGFEIRPVIQPDGQAVVFDFNYMYSTEVREPVRADEKHLGRVKRHYVDTDVQLSNFELREVSRYTVALKAARTAKGVPLFEDIPGVGVLFRPLPSDENSLQQNLIMAQATIFPTLFDLMGLRWASVVSDLDPLTLSNSDFIVRNRRRMVENRVYDESSSYVDEYLRVPEGERRMDLYRSQETVPYVHPNGYMGSGMNLQDSQMQEGYQPNRVYPTQPFVPNKSIEGTQNSPYRRPPQEFYDQNRTTAPPNPTGIREPWKIVNPKSR